MDGAFAGRPPRCDPTCGQRAGALSLAVGENTVEDVFSSAGAGGWRTVPSTPSMKCSSSPGARLRRASPPLKGGSGAVLPAQRGQRSRGLRGRGTSLLRPCGAAPWRGASGRVRPEAGSDSFVLSFEQCESHLARSHRVNVTLLEDLSSSSPCVVAPHAQHIIHMRVTLVCMMQCV